MYAAISLEWIGADSPIPAMRSLRKPWVAEIIDLSRRGIQRHFVEARIDYLRANAGGSRGVYLHWMLPAGLYEVRSFESWRREARYFVSSHDGEITKITRAELETSLRGALITDDK